MKHLRYILGVFLLGCLAFACKKMAYTDVSFARSPGLASQLAVMFDITQDNSGVVTITPNGSGVTTYDVYFGDNTKLAETVLQGKNTKHTYAEGVYSVKIIARNIAGQTTEITQPLTVSFRAPENVKVKTTISKLTVSLTPTGKYETMFKIYFGDSTTVVPIPYASVLDGKTVSHTYVNAGTYIIKIVAVSGGAASTQLLDTVKVAKQIDLPVTFDDSKVDYSVTDFGGAQSAVSPDPVNVANRVMKTIKTAGAQTYAGTTLGTGLGFENPIPISANSTKMSVDVFSPAAGIDVKLKIEDHKDPTHSVEKDVLTTVSGKWETIVFDFKTPTTGTASLNTSYVYDKATIFFDFGKSGDGRFYYFDNVIALPPGLAQIDLPVTFEDPKVDYTVTDFGGNSSTVITDPTNAGNHVMKSVKAAGAATYAGTTLGTGLGFATAVPLTTAKSKMSVRVFSPAAGITVKLKVEDHTNGTHSVESDVKTTVANAFETLVFDFNLNSPSTPAFNAGYVYDKATIFFDFGNAGDGRSYLWDDLIFVNQAATVFLVYDHATGYTLADFGNNSTVLAPDPVNAGKTVVKSTKASGAQTYAGVTMSPKTGLNPPIPLSLSRSKVTVLVYSPAVGIDVKLKFEDHKDPTHTIEKDVKTTLANTWETMTFDFATPSPGTAAFNSSFIYDQSTIFFDFGNVGDGRVYYWDSVNLL